CGSVDHPAVLVHDCSLWRLSAPASGRSSWLENPVEGLVLYTSHARRGPCRSSTFFRLGFNLNFVINSQCRGLGWPQFFHPQSPRECRACLKILLLKIRSNVT